MAEDGGGTSAAATKYSSKTAQHRLSAVCSFIAKCCGAVPLSVRACECAVLDILNVAGFFGQTGKYENIMDELSIHKCGFLVRRGSTYRSVVEKSRKFRCVC